MSKQSTLFFGAAVVDLITYTQRFPAPGETVSGKGFHKGCGGKASNACVMSAKLGLSASMLAKIGDDIFGRELLDNYKRFNINIDNVLLTKDIFTATAAICVADSGQNTIVYVPGPTNQLTPDEIIAIEDQLFNNCQLFMATFECLPETLLTLLKIARKKGVRTLVNGAPPFPNNPLPEMYQLFDTFCVNETEAMIMTGINIESVDDGRKSCRELLKLGCGAVILTMGTNGAIYMDTNSDIYVPIQEKVTPVDTTGAGDAFMGALAYYMVCHPSLGIEEQMKRSCFIATRSVLKTGTQTSYPDKHELPRNLFM
ncbi:ribokinase-like [Oppia nitens]|uniref:ribokinase-like n=1 Tax=Oppia nitens TaxID=1686743 RepID=UPI0023D9D05E|nr:ribokinase-like [Oppia nitens]